MPIVVYPCHMRLNGDMAMTGKSTGITVLIILVFTTVAYFLFDTTDPPPLKTAAIPETPAPGVPPTVPAAPSVADPPPILYPIESPPSGEPLPELGQSDVPFRKALGGVLGKKGLALVLSEELIHHLVVTVDNLPRAHLAADIVPLKRAEGSFITEGKTGNLAISPRNATRYAAYAAEGQPSTPRNWSPCIGSSTRFFSARTRRSVTPRPTSTTGW